MADPETRQEIDAVISNYILSFFISKNNKQIMK